MQDNKKEKYIDPKKLLKTKNLINVYQFQAINKNTGIIQNIGVYEKIPIVKVLEFPFTFLFKNNDYLEFKCDIISNILTEEDINNEYYKLISILFYLDDYLIFSLNYSFYPDTKIVDKNINGKFKINLEYRKNNEDIIKIIEDNTEYKSNNEIISSLISILDEPKFREEIENYRSIY